METTAPNSVSYHQVRDGHMIAYRIIKSSEIPNKSSGTSTPLVLVHGLGGVGLVDWEPLVDHLANQREVLVYDNRDIGSSHPAPKQSPTGRSMSIQDMAEDVSELIQHLGYRSVDLLGYSMGGMIVQQLLIGHPSLPYTIRHVILAASFASNPDNGPLGQKLGSYDHDQQDGQPPVDDPIEPGKQFLMSMYDPEWLGNPQNQKILEMRISKHLGARRPLKTMARQYQAVAKVDQRPDLKRTSLDTIPMLSIHGTQDMLVPLKHQAELLECLPTLEICQLPPGRRFGHMWWDYFEVGSWAKIIDDFLAK